MAGAADALIQSRPAIRLAGVNALVLCENYRKGRNAQGPWRQIVYMTKYDESDAFIDALMMSVTYAGTPGAGTLVYQLPHAYPGNRRLWCAEADAEPMGVIRPDGTDPSQGKLLSADYCRIVATYRVPQFDMEGTDALNQLPGQARPFTSVRRHTHMESESIPNSAVQEGPGVANNIDKSFHYQYPVTEYEITYYHVPYFFDPNLDGIVGQLNSGTFLGYPKGEVMFADYEAEPDTADGGGLRTNTFKILLLRKPWDHNTVWKLEQPLGRVVAEDTSGNNPYQYADLSPVLMPASLLS